MLGTLWNNPIAALGVNQYRKGWCLIRSWFTQQNGAQGARNFALFLPARDSPTLNEVDLCRLRSLAVQLLA